MGAYIADRPPLLIQHRLLSSGTPRLVEDILSVSTFGLCSAGRGSMSCGMPASRLETSSAIFRAPLRGAPCASTSRLSTNRNTTGNRRVARTAACARRNYAHLSSRSGAIIRISRLIIEEGLLLRPSANDGRAVGDSQSNSFKAAMSFGLAIAQRVSYIARGMRPRQTCSITSSASTIRNAGTRGSVI
jgi:hypothetical protein